MEWRRPKRMRPPIPSHWPTLGTRTCRKSWACIRPTWPQEWAEGEWGWRISTWSSRYNGTPWKETVGGHFFQRPFMVYYKRRACYICVEVKMWLESGQIEPNWAKNFRFTFIEIFRIGIWICENVFGSDLNNLSNLMHSSFWMVCTSLLLGNKRMKDYEKTTQFSQRTIDLSEKSFCGDFSQTYFF